MSSTSITATGVVAIVEASISFPQGFVVNDWADDVDPIDIPNVTMGEGAINIDGKRVSWSNPNEKEVTLAVIPGSRSDENLRNLMIFNDPSGGKGTTNDIVTITVQYPDGGTTRLLKGSIKGGPPARSAASGGRIKSQSYLFGFESVAETPGGP